MSCSLHSLGWAPCFENAFRALGQPGWYPARIIRETKINYTLLAPDTGEHAAVLCGRLWHEAETDAALPTVGDWVAADPGEGDGLPVVRALLPRRTCFSRKAPGKSTSEQVIGANVDLVVIVTDAAADYNPRRVERYLTLVRRSRARPVILVNKADECEPALLESVCAALRSLAPDAEVHPVSAREGHGYPEALQKPAEGTTITVVGSSGVGKTTLINSLLGGRQRETNHVNRVTGKGRHTTVARELIPLPGGGLLIDNPGMRELHLWTDARTLRDEFSDLAAIALRCRFSDCRHGSDAGCAIRAALDAGTISRTRYEHFLRLDKEIALLAERAEKRRMTLERVAKRRKGRILRNQQDRLDRLCDLNPNRSPLHE
ncbi:MAG: ribosome small subunit-dependent GTPase A [Akkermansiaceae bacterium]|nr:ribosome small subunit-dependent GTPase A [Akkermansiaceae bacterium]